MARVLSVNTSVDQNDGSISGGLSLRDAILIANSDSKEDYVIELQGGKTYFLTIEGQLDNSSRPENAGLTGDLDIAAGGKVTIKSIGAGQAMIDGSGFGSGFRSGDRIFHVLENSNFSLDRVTLTNSSVGGIRVEKNATADISNSLITRNIYVPMSGSSASSDGGGLLNLGNTTLQACTISHNKGFNYGGGIYNQGTLTIKSSHIISNQADVDGGGIYSSGTLTILNSTIDGNTSGHDGSGLHNIGTTNSTDSIFRNNQKTGVYNSGTLTLTRGSIDGNQSTGLENQGNAIVAGTNIANNTEDGIYNSKTLVIQQSTVTKNGRHGIYNSPDIPDNEHNFTTITKTSIADNQKTGIYNWGKLDISDSTISSNKDGGLFNRADATIKSSTIRNNSTEGNGGGIDNRIAKLTLVNSSIEGNTAKDFGGGMYNQNDQLQEVVIINSTFSNNHASFGGGLLNTGYTILGTKKVPPRDTTALLTAINITISGNTASKSGGGIYNDARGSITLLNNTITDNHSRFKSTEAGAGGGIYNEMAGGLLGNKNGVVTSKNTIIAGNTDAADHRASIPSPSPDVNGPINGANNNLIGDLRGASGSIGTGSDLVNPSPKLGKLQNNGGFTLTHALLDQSPAINRGSNVLIPADSLDLDGNVNTTERLPYDQRGTGFQRLSAGVVDIGAFEKQEPPSRDNTAPTMVSITVEGRQLLLSFSEPVRTTGLNPARFSVTIDSASRSISDIHPGATASQLRLILAGSLPTANQIMRLRYNDLSPANDATGVIQDNAGNDLATIASPGRAIDTWHADTTVSVLAATTTTLVLTGSSAINGQGNSNANIIRGNGAANTLAGEAGADRLNGEAGNDLLIGGMGHDTLSGGLGADIFRFNTPLNASSNQDRLTDFHPVEGDRIQLQQAIFSSLTTKGPLASTAFRSASAFNTRMQRILYQSNTGTLLYDIDGNGPSQAIPFASLNTGLELRSDYFVVV